MHYSELTRYRCSSFYKLNEPAACIAPQRVYRIKNNVYLVNLQSCSEPAVTLNNQPSICLHHSSIFENLAEYSFTFPSLMHIVQRATQKRVASRNNKGLTTMAQMLSEKMLHKTNNAMAHAAAAAVNIYRLSYKQVRMQLPCCHYATS